MVRDFHGGVWAFPHGWTEGLAFVGVSWARSACKSITGFRLCT